MTRKLLLNSLILVASAFTASPAAGQLMSEVRTEDGLDLRLGADGTVAAVTLDNRALRLLPEGAGFDVTEFLPPDGARRQLGLVRGNVVQTGAGVEMRGGLPDAGLDFRARFRGLAGRIEVEGEVTDTTGRDRALMVVFRLPIQAEGWRWGDDMDRVRL